MTEPSFDKAQLRGKIRQARARRADHNSEACTSGFFTQACSVLENCHSCIAYAALPGEPCLDTALDWARRRGTRVYLPVATPGQPLRFGLLDCHPAELPPMGKWKIREPEPQYSAPEVFAGRTPTKDALAGAHTGQPPSVILVPGLAFSPAGYRLGNGGGFYDRTFGPEGIAPLDSAPMAVYGVCFAEEIRTDIGVEPWDLRVDTVLTEAGIRPVSS